MVNKLNGFAPVSLSLLRAVAGLIFLLHGTQKLFGFPEPQWPVEAFSLPWFAGAIELVTGVLLILGLFTRPAAFLASGTMAAAYWMAHAPQNLFPTLNGGDAAILYCFIFLYLVFAGGGSIGLDASREGKAA
ncbi:MAG: DoxX family protein [Pseudomonadota bacterium]